LTTPNILLWDIEATNLNADFGVILSVSWKRLHEKKVHNVNIGQFKSFQTDRTNDKEVVKQAIATLSEADMIVDWFGTYYDIPMLNTRALFHGLQPLPPIAHVDGWMIAKRKMKLHSNRLASVQSFLGVEEKTPLNGPIWIRAAAGYKDALAYVVEHNDQDCVVLEQVYDKIKGLCNFHPNVSVMSGSVDDEKPHCPICDSAKLQQRGRTVTKTGFRQRFQCTACGGWFSGKHQKVADIS